MDPITTLMTALVAGAPAAAKNVTAQAVKDGYAGLKALVIRKLGGKRDIGTSIQQIEVQPDSKGRRATLEEDLAAVGADQDEELIRQAAGLIELLKRHAPETVTTYTATQINSSGATAQGPGATAGGAGSIAIGGGAKVRGPLPGPTKPDEGTST
jgi:hypothetical protein